MNILFISHGLYPCKIGGAEIFNYYLIKELSKFCKIYLLTCCQKINLKVTLIYISRRKFGPGRISIPLQDIINIGKLRNKIDLVHISYMRADWILWLPYPLGKKLFGVPYIFTIHDGMYKWKPAFPHRLLFDNAEAIVAVSHRLKEEYEKRSGREIKFIPPLIPFRRCNEEKEYLRNIYGFTSTDTIILFLGSIKKIKGCDTLLEAFIRLGREFIKIHRLRLLFVGDGDLKKKLEKRVEKENLGIYVRFLGSIPYEEVSSLFKIADIYVIPSLSEGLSISMLEAMFNGLPIIGADTIGINNIIEHGKNGLLFKVGDPIDLMNKIIYLLENSKVRENISHAAKKSYEDNYRYETIVKEYLNIYTSVGQKK